MEYVKSIVKWKGPAKRTCIMLLPMAGIVSLFALVFGLSITFADNAAATRGGGYRTFAKVSNSEKTLNENDCRKYGGRQVTNREFDVVMKTGRSDNELYNVLYYSGYQYVTFKVDASNSITRLFGIENHTIGLCQF